MFARISGNVFKIAILNLLQSNQKTSVSFLLKGGILYLQAAGSIVHDSYVSVLEYDAEGEIVVNIDQTLNLIDIKENVRISIHGDLLEIKQSSFQYNATALPEQRVDSDAFSISKATRLDKEELLGYVNSTRSLDEVAKLLTFGMAPIHVSDKTAYLYYSNTVYTNRLRLPDCSLSGEFARKLMPILSRAGDCFYSFNEESGLMYLGISKSEVVTLTTQKQNKQIIQGVKNIDTKLRDVARVDLTRYKEYMDIICKAYKKQLIEFSVCEDGIRLYIDNVNTKFDIGSRNDSLLSIKISSAQILAVSRLFGNSNNVVIKRGDNCLCFMQPNQEKKLIIAGMLY